MNNFILPANPKYDTEIPQLQPTDPVHADDMNMRLAQMLGNIHAVKQMTDDLEVQTNNFLIGERLQLPLGRTSSTVLRFNFDLSGSYETIESTSVTERGQWIPEILLSGSGLGERLTYYGFILNGPEALRGNFVLLGNVCYVHCFGWMSIRDDNYFQLKSLLEDKSYHLRIRGFPFMTNSIFGGDRGSNGLFGYFFDGTSTGFLQSSVQAQGSALFASTRS